MCFILSHPFLSNQNRITDTFFIVIVDDLKRAWTFKFYVYTWRLASKFSKPEMFVLMRVGGWVRGGGTHSHFPAWESHLAEVRLGWAWDGLLASFFDQYYFHQYSSVHGPPLMLPSNGRWVGGRASRKVVAFLGACNDQRWIVSIDAKSRVLNS